jgi:hypothetical protein
VASKADQIQVVARQAVSAMVGRHIEVSVDADRVLPAAPRRIERAMVQVEMTGPNGAPHQSNVTASAKAEAAAWGMDEIVSAARRAANTILTRNPTWRRTSE